MVVCVKVSYALVTLGRTVLLGGTERNQCFSICAMVCTRIDMITGWLGGWNLQ